MTTKRIPVTVTIGPARPAFTEPTTGSITTVALGNARSPSRFIAEIGSDGVVEIYRSNFGHLMTTNVQGLAEAILHYGITRIAPVKETS